jgi:hypothetical protein
MCFRGKLAPKHLALRLSSGVNGKYDMSVAPQISSLRIARALGEAESLMDQTLISLANLQAELLEARKHPDVCIHTGQKAIIRLASANQSLVSGQNDLFRVHDVMSSVSREMGIAGEQTAHSDLEVKGEALAA